MSFIFRPLPLSSLAQYLFKKKGRACKNGGGVTKATSNKEIQLWPGMSQEHKETWAPLFSNFFKFFFFFLDIILYDECVTVV